MPKAKGEWVVEPTTSTPEPTGTVMAPTATPPAGDVVAAMVEALLRQSKALETQVERTAPKENPNYQVKSLFLKPSGEPYAADLKCDIYVGPALLNKTPLTADEVVQANRLRPMAKCRVTKMDRTTVIGSVTALTDASDQVSRITVHLPMAKDDNPQMYPPLDELLKQIADQGEAEAAA
jgi:hypothetical protein